ncbi:MAG: LTA synthase family protein [Gammaproteobacteria bacterium]|nr:LTA synthase family protein [Gammaproteobacteria bacterium]
MNGSLPAVTRGQARLGPAGVLLLALLLGLVWLALARAGLLLLFHERITGVAAPWRIFTIGLRMDTVLLCELLAIPALLYLLLPGRALREWLTATLLALAAALLVHMELSTPAFIAEYDHRPDRVYYEYLRYPREVFTMLARSYPLQLLLVPLVSGAAAFAFWRLLRRQMRAGPDWPWRRRALLAPLVIVLLFLGGRSSLGPRPANLSTATFSSNHLANELAVSSTYTLFNAIYMSRKEVDATRLYGTLEPTEIEARVARYRGPARVAAAPPPRPPNLVILVLESVGAEFVGSLGGLPLTPNLERLSAEGLWFTSLYATGTRTVRGLEAIVTGFPPTPAPAVFKLPQAQRDFFTLGSLLQAQGYATEFIYGGVSNFDNMGRFLLQNGFARVIEQRDFRDPVLLGNWGVADEDLVAMAHATFLAHGDQPFFALLLSTSNHDPFEFPAGRIELFEQPAATRNNAVKYTDYAVGRLFELARTAPYFHDTIFVVVADHAARVVGEDLVPVARFQIPALITGPGVPRRHYDRVASQIDLGPTLLGLLGIDAPHPMIGRDLLALPEDLPGRALMQYGDANAFLAGERVAIHRPKLPAETFAYRAGRLQPLPHDAELERDALAHLLWAAHAYRDRRYRPLTAAPAD